MLDPKIKGWINELVKDQRDFIDKKKDNRELYLTLMKDVFGYAVTGGNQMKFPASTNAQAIGDLLEDDHIDALKNKKTTPAKIGAQILEQAKKIYPQKTPGTTILNPKKDAIGLRQGVDAHDYKGQEDLEQLRWISSYAYGWLYQNGLKTAKGDPRNMEEVQTLWDGNKLYIAENDAINTKALANMFKNGIDLNMPMAKDPDLDNRLKRHVKDLLKIKEGSDPMIDAFFSGEPKGKIEFVAKGDREKHAEVRLAEEWVNDAKTKKLKNPKISVAGIKRPCLACYSRLEAIAKRNPFVTLNHKPRTGLFWPSSNAFRGLTIDDAIEIVTYMLSLQPYFLGADGSYNYDTDSDFSDLSDAESDDKGVLKDRKVNIFDKKSREAARKLLKIKVIDRKRNDAAALSAAANIDSDSDTDMDTDDDSDPDNDSGSDTNTGSNTDSDSDTDEPPAKTRATDDPTKKKKTTSRPRTALGRKKTH